MPTQRMVLITGASSGVGQSTVRLLSQRGDKLSEPVGIPPHLSLPPFRSAALDLPHDQQPPACGTNDTDA
jgi:hypothetical protein